MCGCMKNVVVQDQQAQQALAEQARRDEAAAAQARQNTGAQPVGK